MKKFFLVAALAVSGIVMNAQTSFGLKAGANFATWTGSDADGAKMKVGFHAGGQANIHLSSMFSVQPELLFSMVGPKFDGGQFNLAYIDVPVMLQYNNPSGFYAEVGPKIGFLMSAKAEVDGINGKTDIKDQLKSTDFAFALGLGYKMKSGFGIGARYNMGLSDVGDGSNAKNSVIGLGVFYTLGGKK
jgi:hypothetical protein